MQRIDIVNIRRFRPNVQAIDVALPVLAYECEAALPLESSLDAYEEATLRLLSLKLGVRGISNALNASESLVEVVISSLEDKRYVKREHCSPWSLTEDGERYLDGTIEERASAESQYGYVFVNAIKKEVLPYFYRGDVGRIPLFDLSRDGTELPLKLTSGGAEEATFVPIRIRQPKLKAAYQRYFRNMDLARQSDRGEITLDDAREESADPFADLDSLDEEANAYQDYEDPLSQHDGQMNVNMLIRTLRKDPTNLYLRMRIVIDPMSPGGYKVESPFDLDGIDDDYFLRQIQWLEQSGDTFLGDRNLQDVITDEVCKIGPQYTVSEKDFSFFIKEQMYAFKASEHQAQAIYEEMRQIYSSMQVTNSTLDRENIVGSISRHIVEQMLNAIFRRIDKSELDRLSNTAKNDINRDRSNRNADFKARICRYAGLPSDALENAYANVRTIVKTLANTHGNGITQKVTNLLIVNYYLANSQTRKLFSSLSQSGNLDEVIAMNHIRNKASHDTDEPFTDADYDVFMGSVFSFINIISNALWGE